MPHIEVGISDRLRAAREQLGIKQADFAELTGVSRSTQIAYEKGSTSPTTDYLQSAEKIGVSIPELLFAKSLDAATCAQPDWRLIQECVENVEFFCLRYAPTCPPSYRWKMIAELYEAQRSATKLITNDEIFMRLKNFMERDGV